MSSRRLRLWAFLALGAYLPALTLAVCLHDHPAPPTDARIVQTVPHPNDPEPPEPEAPRSPLSHDDCVICQFFGTKFLAGDEPGVASLNVVCCEVVPPSAAPFEIRLPGLPPARAPPQAG